MLVCAVRDLSPPGELSQQVVLPFEFKNVEMEYESYRGTQVRLRSFRAPNPTPPDSIVSLTCLNQGNCADEQPFSLR